MPTYHEEEDDPGTDDPSLDAPQLIGDLQLSRHVLHIAENASKTFDENLVHSAEHRAKEFSTLASRKDLAEKAIRACQTSTNEFLRDMFVRFGRQQKEALTMQKSSLDSVKKMMRRKILLLKRGIDSDTHGRMMALKERKKNDFQRQQVETVLEDRKVSGDIMFRTTIPNAYLRRVARLTRKLIQGINGTMTYVDLIRDLAGKFGRIREYMHEDAVIFTRNMNDLTVRIKHQQQELDYMNSVLQEATRASHHAEREYFDSAGNLEQTEEVHRKMLEDLKKCLLEHQKICTDCTAELVSLNEKFKGVSHGCLYKCPENVRQYPHGMHGRVTSPNGKRKMSDNLKAPTELFRTFQIMMELTRARNPEEVVEVFHEQIKRANLMQNDVNRLEHLLITVLRPEHTMFENEHETNEAAAANRAAAAEKTIKDLQDSFDQRVEEARSIVNQQRDSAREFDFFMETLLSINDRISDTFSSRPAMEQIGETSSDQSALKLSGQPTVGQLIATTENNLRFIADKMTDYFRLSWDKLQLLVEEAHFLEYRALKIPPNNNRVLFDTACDVMNTERMRAPTPQPHPRFLTNAQFKAANKQILERARMAELARLKETRKEAEKAEHHDYGEGKEPTKKDKKKNE